MAVRSTLRKKKYKRPHPRPTTMQQIPYAQKYYSKKEDT